MEFADKLQKFRKERGMSQENLAAIIGVSRQSVSKWESGQAYPELDKIIALSELFNVTVDNLVKNTPSSTESAENVQHIRYVDSRYMYRYEYKSKRTWRGLPLVHINIGRGIHVAKGIIAIGNIAIGGLSIGGIALGGLCLGGLGFGLVSSGGVVLGLLMALGGVAIAPIAIGALAIGIIAIGSLAIGMFSVGACAIASHIAIGQYATGHIAIGESVRGAQTLLMENNKLISAEQVRALIYQEYPRLWKPIVERIISIFN
ncbi:XRE family transcriptional regulator [Paenibacillus anaericanus]|uniref:XRE family transcriptional regulator n=1 Tax=Paenibacillus anaericanus TaxID=170367 RepID=A0A433YBL7_9BACL|nr:helix-turn-helix transcriptional regulator [Paenibacillus anaericanus]RUT47253.1 XRE family transcriptional regulator [Paenibacillus anaericanus]